MNLLIVLFVHSSKQWIILKNRTNNRQTIQFTLRNIIFETSKSRNCKNRVVCLPDQPAEAKLIELIELQSWDNCGTVARSTEF